jgi:propionyl-CoA carboxylase alpha chain
MKGSPSERRVVLCADDFAISAPVSQAIVQLAQTQRLSATSAMVLSPRAAELLKLMPFKAPPDLSRWLLSPMPGLLVQIAVQAGQKVLAGEKLAVVEAMKMENSLTASQDGVVKQICARAGESLSVDQAIIEFE